MVGAFICLQTSAVGCGGIDVAIVGVGVADVGLGAGVNSSVAGDMGGVGAAVWIGAEVGVSAGSVAIGVGEVFALGAGTGVAVGVVVGTGASADAGTGVTGTAVDDGSVEGDPEHAVSISRIDTNKAMNFVPVTIVFSPESSSIIPQHSQLSKSGVSE